MLWNLESFMRSFWAEIPCCINNRFRSSTKCNPPPWTFLWGYQALFMWSSLFTSSLLRALLIQTGDSRVVKEVIPFISIAFMVVVVEVTNSCCALSINKNVAYYLQFFLPLAEEKVSSGGGVEIQCSSLPQANPSFSLPAWEVLYGKLKKKNMRRLSINWQKWQRQQGKASWPR